MRKVPEIEGIFYLDVTGLQSRIQRKKQLRQKHGGARSMEVGELLSIRVAQHKKGDGGTPGKKQDEV